MKLLEALYADGSWTQYANGGGYYCCYKQVGDDCFTVRQLKGPFNFEQKESNDSMNELDEVYILSKELTTVEVFYMSKVLERKIKGKYGIDGWNPGGSYVW